MMSIGDEPKSLHSLHEKWLKITTKHPIVNECLKTPNTARCQATKKTKRPESRRLSAAKFSKSWDSSSWHQNFLGRRRSTFLKPKFPVTPLLVGEYVGLTLVFSNFPVSVLSLFPFKKSRWTKISEASGVDQTFSTPEIQPKNDGLEDVYPFKNCYVGISMLNFRGV